MSLTPSYPGSMAEIVDRVHAKFGVTPTAYQPQADIAASGLLPHQAEFGDVLDSIREKTSQAIPYKGTFWWVAYYAFIEGKQSDPEPTYEEARLAASDAEYYRLVGEGNGYDEDAVREAQEEGAL